MNIRKPTDYNTMYVALDRLIAADLPQVELYFEIGCVVCSRTEKGAAVAASEYLQAAHPKAIGFSPRNLRRMRKFFRTYENTPELLRIAMRLGWTQNVVILESELTMEERAWYLRTAERFHCSKKELADQINTSAHLEKSLDDAEEICHTEQEKTAQEHEEWRKKNIFYVSRPHLQKPDGRVRHERLGEDGGIGTRIPHRIGSYQPGGNRKSTLSTSEAETGRTWDRMYWKSGPPASNQRLQPVRFTDCDGPRKSIRHVSHLRRQLRWEDAPLDGICRFANQEVATLRYTGA